MFSRKIFKKNQTKNIKNYLKKSKWSEISSVKKITLEIPLNIFMVTDHESIRFYAMNPSIISGNSLIIVL